MQSGTRIILMNWNGCEYTFRECLMLLRACGKSLAWVGNKTFDEAWYSCESKHWMWTLLDMVYGKHATDVILGAKPYKEFVTCDYIRAKVNFHDMRMRFIDLVGDEQRMFYAQWFDY